MKQKHRKIPEFIFSRPISGSIKWSDIDMFRGEILGLNGGSDLYGKTPDELRLEFKNSLKIFLDTGKEKGIEPYKSYSGNNLRIPQGLHAEIASRASKEGKSLNQWIVETINEVVHTR